MLPATVDTRTTVKLAFSWLTATIWPGLRESRPVAAARPAGILALVSGRVPKNAGLKRAWRALAVALAVAGAPAAGHANIFAEDGADPRQLVDAVGPAAIYAPIGMTTTDGPVAMREGGGSVVRAVVNGTGFMISPCLMLTNFHTVFGDAKTEPNVAQPHYVRFEVGAEPGRKFRRRARAEVLAWGDFAHSEEGDWAVARVEGCPGSDPQIGWLATSHEAAATLVGAQVSMAGFAGELGERRLSVQGVCRIHDVTDQGLAHDCASTGGASGAPLMVMQDGHPTAVGLASGADWHVDGVLPRFDQRHANWAVDVATVLADPRVKSLLDAELAGGNRAAR
jgi:V8-like Glu-specific endopeptidase